MVHQLFSLGNEGLVRQISAGLHEAAERLEYADSYEDFLSAVERHAQVWRSLCDAAPNLHLEIPERIMAFSTSAPKKLRRGLSDYEIEALIRFDRYISEVITEALGALP